MPHKRGPWSTNEDANLLTLVHHHGPQNWVRISQHLGSRSPKQCRERYHQNLKPTLNHSPITAQEGDMIESLVKQIGRRWADISRRLPGRSDNAVKNWWNGGVNRRRRVVVRRDVLSKPARNFESGAQTFLQGQVGTMADQRALPASVPQIPMNVPLMSPVRSEVSMPDSIGEAPSLVSDHGSQQTIPSPGEYSHILHLAPNAGAVTPGIWYRGSNMLSGLSLQNVGSRHVPTSPIIIPPVGRSDSNAAACRLHHLSEIAANKDTLPTAQSAHPSVTESAVTSQPTASIAMTSDRAVQPSNRLHDASVSRYGAVGPEETLRRLVHGAQSRGLRSSPSGGQRDPAVRSSAGLAGDVTSPAYHRPDLHSPALVVHQPPLEHYEQKEGSDRVATLQCLSSTVSPDHTDDHATVPYHRSGAIPEARKNKMTLSSILL